MGSLDGWIFFKIFWLRKFFKINFLNILLIKPLYDIAKVAKKVVKKAAPKKVAPKKKVAKKVAKKAAPKKVVKKTAPKKKVAKKSKGSKKWTEWNLFIILIVSIVNLKNHRKTKSNFLINSIYLTNFKIQSNKIIII